MDLEVFDAGSSGGFPLLYHHGTPFAGPLYVPFVAAAQAAGLRLISFSRRGYGTSPEQAGRTVADVVTDVAAVLDALSIGPFLTLGWSGGGPHAIACAALLGDRCLAAATIGGVAPYDTPDLDWLAGMGEENVAEFGALLAGEPAHSESLERQAAELRTIAADEVVASLGDLVPAVDAAHLTGEFAEWFATCLRHSVANGIAGWRDDDLAFVRPWGFDLADVTSPVSIWQGSLDRMVPFAHGEWLVANLSSAQGHLLIGEGHLSVMTMIDDILADLARHIRGGNS